MKSGRSRLWSRRRFACYIVLLAMLCSLAGISNPVVVYAGSGAESVPETSLIGMETMSSGRTVTSEVYTVTVDSGISGGAITVNPSSAAASETVTVTVTPETGKQLVAGSLKYNEGADEIEITATEGVYSFAMPAADVTVTAQFEGIPAETYSIARAPVPDPIWTVTTDQTSAAAGETVTVTVSDTTATSWATGLVVTGASGMTYGFTTITAATGNANGLNGAGVYSFVMPAESVTVGFTAGYTLLEVYIRYGAAGEDTVVHSYTRAEMEALASVNTEPIHYAMYDRMPAVFMGKAVTYVTIEQLTASAATYNSDVRFDGPDCSLRGSSLDGWTLGTDGLSWDYLMGQPRSYYAGIGDQYLDPANRTGEDREVPAVLAITGWAGRQTQVDNQPYDTLNTYRFFYGQTEAEYGNGVLPTQAEKEARCTANNTSKWVNRVIYVVPEASPATYTVTADSGITGGSLVLSPTSGSAGTTVTVTVSPDPGKELLAGSLKYTTDGGSTYAPITAAEGVYSFVMPAADTVVTALFVDPAAAVTGVSLDKSAVTLTVGNFDQLTATVTPSDAGNQDVTWTSDNAAVATVSSAGLVRATGAGSANITATTVEGGFTAACAVTVQAASTDHFTLAVLPDTQFYAESYPQIFAQQTQWIADQAAAQNIVFVAHVGDIQDDYDNSAQWQTAQAAMATIRTAGIPYSLVPGNHDLNFTTGDATNFDTYFPYTDFTGYSWYGGHYPDDSNTSSYQLFSAMGQDFIVLNLVCTPTLLAAATDWANAVLTQYSDRKAIVVTHGYIKPNGEYAGGEDVSGPAIHENIVKGHGNVIAVLCGHIAGQYHGTDTGENGNTVYNLLTNYTDLPDGGNGWLRLYQFYPGLDTVKAVTYSPYLDQYDTSANGQFELFLPMEEAQTYAVTVDSAISGGAVGVNPASAAAGDTVTVTVTPDPGKQLVAGSLKYTTDGGATYTEITVTESVYSFAMPAADVAVTAQFEEVPAAAPAWDGSVDVSWYNTTDTVFYINTPAKLAGLAAIVNGIYNTGATVIGNPDYIVYNVGGGSLTGSTTATWVYGGDDFDGKTIYLTADLDMGGVYDSVSGTWSGPNYMPIGGQYCMTYQDGTTLIGASWNGTFDGRGHTVKNIYCSRHAGSLGYEFSQSVGLIGRMGVHDDDPVSLYASPSVKNVAVTGYIFANRSVGGIVGKNGKSYGSVIENCINYASVSNTDSKGVGGIAGAGWNSLTIKNCANLGNIYTSYSNAGGISGSCEAQVFNSYNVGYVGASTVSQAQSLGTNNGGAVWTNCYWLDGSSASNQAVYNSTVGSTITKMDTEESMKTEAFLIALNGDGRAWVADTNNINSGYPIPRSWTADSATVTSVTKESDPSELTYIAGQTFDPAGLAIWANYSDGTREKVTDYTISKTAALETTDTSITVSGVSGGIAYSYDFAVVVEANALASIAITTVPVNLLYAAGETFNPTGMVVKASYTNGTTVTLTAGAYTLSPDTSLTPADTTITVSYTEGGVTKTVGQPIRVLASGPPALNGDVYELSTADHLLWFANQVNTGLNNGIKGKLLNDIDLSQETWKPIGNSSSRRYTGAFDGDGKTLTLAISGSANYTGLFGYVQGGTVKDLTVAGSVSGGQYTAGIVANASGASVIQNCINNATVVSTSYYVGGIVAYATDTTAVSGCANSSAVSSASYNVGGIAGYIAGSTAISGSTNNGSVTGTYNVGGIVGNAYGANTISRCANNGAVTATSTATTASYSVGGIAGYTYAAATIDRCSNSGAISGGVMNVGGVAGYLNNASAALTNSYNTGSVISESASNTAHTGGVVGYTNNNTCTVQNSYNTGAITVSNTGAFTAGVIGYAKANTNVSNNYYLNTTASQGLGYATDNAESKTPEELKSAAFAALLGAAYIAQDNAYPILAWQGPAAPATYTVTVDSGISGGIVAVNPASAAAGETITVTVTSNAGKQLAAGSLKYTTDSGATYTEITATGGVYSFALPAADVVVTALFEDLATAPQYTVTPEANEPVYEAGTTAGGISTMTVKTGVSGLQYFSVQIVPVNAHEGLESVVFVHLRNEVQQSRNATRTDFDTVQTARAGFNVQAGDVIEVYIVDELTNALDHNPTILQ
jgi:hypothetical protein